jgi:hypothetical protein
MSLDLALEPAPKFFLLTKKTALQSFYNFEKVKKIIFVMRSDFRGVKNGLF